MTRVFLAYADDVRAQDSAAYAIQVCTCAALSLDTVSLLSLVRVCSMSLCCTAGAFVHLWVSWGSNWLARPPSVEEVPGADSRNTGTAPQQQVIRFKLVDLQEADPFAHNPAEAWFFFALFHLLLPPSLCSGIRAVRRRLTGLNWRSQYTWVREAVNSLIGQPRGPDTSSARFVINHVVVVITMY